jgi:hypothetical protein
MIKEPSSGQTNIIQQNQNETKTFEALQTKAISLGQPDLRTPLAGERAEYYSYYKLDSAQGSNGITMGRTQS